MAPIRLRHPKGVSTINIDLDADSTTVQALQQAILTATEIPPSLQELKTGYPPQSLTLIPQLPVSSLGLQGGDQLIVTQTSGGGLTHAPPPTRTVSPPSLSQQPAASHIPRPVEQARRDEYVHTDGGALIHRVVPDDNSCLFSSVGIVFEQDMGVTPRLRRIVADTIRNDPETYTEAMLGRPREEYIHTILRPNSWGGAIELSIFAAYYATEISSIDIETGRLDRFGEGASYSSRAILLYSGIHYDATSLAPAPDVPVDFHETRYPIDNMGVLAAAKDLASRLRAQKKFTNTATFLLRCEICGAGLKGEKEARQHAGDTGHVQFGEYS